MGSVLERMREKYPDGIPLTSEVPPDRVADQVAKAATHLPEGAIDEDVKALNEATAANDREKQILAILAMAAKAGLRIAFPA